MRKWMGLGLLVVLLCGCSGKDEEIQRAVDLRMRMLNACCTFDCGITADYGDEVTEFSVSCETDTEGNLAFTVTEPETIAGITGLIRKDGGQLTFEDTALAFPLLAEEQISPVSAPWIFFTTLRGGYLASAAQEELLHLSVDDSFQEDALRLDIWLDGNDLPVRGEILYDGRRILTLCVSNFQIQ